MKLVEDLRKTATYLELYAKAGEHLIPTPTTVAQLREAADALAAFEDLGLWAPNRTDPPAEVPP